LPTSQPKILTIIREHVKVGRSADHSKFEAGYVAAFEKAKWPHSYVALTSMTGPSEAWYLEPGDSFAAIGEEMKRSDKDPELSAELKRLDRADAENISSVEPIRAVARPDLSVGAFPDVTKIRFYEISVFHVRPGREADFEEIAKAYVAAFKRAVPKASSRVYQVVAGMDQPAFLIFSSAASYGEFDQHLAEGQATMAAATPEEMAKLKKFSEVAERVENNHFRLDPVQSYVSKEVRESDREFWMGK
jgi:hypothetical protein